jgi:hypothetical protein
MPRGIIGITVDWCTIVENQHFKAYFLVIKILRIAFSSSTSLIV